MNVIERLKARAAKIAEAEQAAHDKVTARYAMRLEQLLEPYSDDVRDAVLRSVGDS